MFHSAPDSIDLCARRQRMTLLLQDTIVMLCRNMIKFDAELSVEGLLGVTVDKKDVVLINIKELITNQAQHQSPISEDATNCSFISHLNRAGCDNAKRTVVKLKSTKREERAIKVERNGPAEIISGQDASIAYRTDDRSMKRISEGNEPLLCNIVDRSLQLHQKPVTQPALSHFCNPDINPSLRDAVVEREPSYRPNAKRKRKDSWTSTTVRNNEHIESLHPTPPITKTKKRFSKCAEQMSGSIKTEPVDVNPTSVTHNLSSFGENSQSTTWRSAGVDDKSTLDQSALSSQLAGGGEAAWLANICTMECDPSGTLLYRCLVCAQPFSSKHHLRRHHNSQHSFTPLQYFCSTCGAGFRRMDVMRRHCKSVHREVDNSIVGLNSLDSLTTNELENSIKETPNSNDCAVFSVAGIDLQLDTNSF